MTRLNVGCGPRYLEGWVNIDACDMFRRDVAMSLPEDKLAERFGAGLVDEIYMADVMEHFYRCDGVEVLKDFSAALKPGGTATIVTPDLERLIVSPTLSLQRKTELIRGAQGQPGPMESGQLMAAWRAHPKLFSHPYTWTERELRQEMSGMGFAVGATTWKCDWEMVVTARKAGA